MSLTVDVQPIMSACWTRPLSKHTTMSSGRPPIVMHTHCHAAVVDACYSMHLSAGGENVLWALLRYGQGSFRLRGWDVSDTCSIVCEMLT